VLSRRKHRNSCKVPLGTKRDFLLLRRTAYAVYMHDYKIVVDQSSPQVIALAWDAVRGHDVVRIRLTAPGASAAVRDVISDAAIFEKVQ